MTFYRFYLCSIILLVKGLLHQENSMAHHLQDIKIQGSFIVGEKSSIASVRGHTRHPVVICLCCLLPTALKALMAFLVTVEDVMFSYVMA